MRRKELVAARKAKGLTQEELANKAGIKRSYYRLIEAGTRNPSLSIAIDITRALDAQIEHLFPNEIFFANRCYRTKQQ